MQVEMGLANVTVLGRRPAYAGRNGTSKHACFREGDLLIQVEVRLLF